VSGARDLPHRRKLEKLEWPKPESVAAPEQFLKVTRTMLPNSRTNHQKRTLSLIGRNAFSMKRGGPRHVELTGNSKTVFGRGRVIRVDPLEDTRWEAFVAAHPDGSVYHHPLWLQVITQAYGDAPVCFAYETADGQLLGVLPLVHKRGLLNRNRFASLPHTPVAGPLASDAKVTKAMVNAAIQWVREHKGAQLQLKVTASGLETAISELSAVLWEESYELKLPNPAQPMRFGNSRNHARIKWAVNKATRCGVSVREAVHESELRGWYQLYLETMRWHFVPARPYKFFQRAWDVLRPRGLMKLLVAEQKTGAVVQLLAGSVFLTFARTMYYAFNGRRRDALALRPNDIIQWHAIREACARGCRRYDLGEVADSDHGLADFKAKWGAEPRRFYRYYYPPSRDYGLLFREDSFLRRHTRTMWRHIPLGATAVLGEWLYRNV